MSDAAVEAGEGRFGYLEIALVGVPLLLGVITIAVVLGPKVLPDRRARSIPPGPLGRATTRPGS